MGNNNQFSYIFIPFSMEHSDRFQALTKAVTESGKWDPVHDNIRYMLKYVADKYVDTDNQKRLYYHFTLRDDARQDFQIAPEDQWFQTTDALPVNGTWKHIRFHLNKVHLFCFGTRMCILAYQISLEKTEALEVADSLFHLKLADQEVEQVMPAPAAVDAVHQPSITALRLAQTLVEEFQAVDSLTFFGHMDPQYARANVLT
jgi:hypothetical protein